MNVLIINTSDKNGGAAIAAYRLLNALNSSGINAKMIVNDKLSNDKDVLEIGNKHINKFNFYHERGEIFLYNGLSRDNLFEVSMISILSLRALSTTETELRDMASPASIGLRSKPLYE